MLFQTRLKELSVKNNLTQKVISEYLGITDRAYRKYLTGENEPTMSRLIALSALFEVSLDYLVGLTGNPKINK